MTLKLTCDDGTVITPKCCPRCADRHWIRQTATYTANGLMSTSTGAPIPCPDCQPRRPTA